MNKFLWINRCSLTPQQIPNNGNIWLFNTIDEYNNNKDNDIRIPRKANGDTYELEDLNEEQFKIAYVFLKKLKNGLVLQQYLKNVKKVLSLYV
jgi:hypothetical protein